MPSVPTYGGNQQQTQALPGVKRQAFAVADPLGPAVEKLAAGVEDVAQFEQTKADQFDEGAVAQLLAEKERRTTAKMWDDGGLLRLRGRDALDAAPTIKKSLADDDQELLGKANTQQQRIALQKQLYARASQNDQIIARHVGTQTDAYQDDQVNTLIGAKQDLAAKAGSMGDEAAMHSAIVDMTTAIRTQYSRKGLDEQSAVSEIQRQESAIHLNVVGTLLAKNDPINAWKYFNKYKDSMSPRDRLSAEKPVTDARDIADGTTAIDGMVTGGMVVKHDPEPPAGSSTGPVVSGPMTKVRAGHPVANLIRERAPHIGVDGNMAVVLATVEGPLDPEARNGSSIGVFQMQGPDWAEFGGTAANRFDLNAQVDIGLMRVAKDIKVARATLGREPQAWEAYMIHQQGYAGGAALLKADRGASAVDVLKPFYKSEAIARSAITGNGGKANMTAGEFVDHIATVFSRKAGQQIKVAAAQPVSTNAPQGVPDLATMVETARQMAGPNLDRQKTFVALATQKHAALKQAETEAENKAKDAVQPFLHNPQVTTFGQIPPSVYHALSPEAQTGVRSYFEELAKTQGKVKTDPALFNTLANLHGTDPKKFASINPVDYASKLSESDFQQIVGWRTADQQSLAKPTPDPHAVTASRISSVTGDMMKARGIGLPGLKGQAVQDDAAMQAQFTRQMYDRAAAYRAANGGKEPDDAELTKIADLLLLQGTYKNPAGKDVKGHVFQSTTGTFHYETPKEWKDRIKAGFAKEGVRNPTDAQIGARYAHWVNLGIVH